MATSVRIDFSCFFMVIPSCECMLCLLSVNWFLIRPSPHHASSILFGDYKRPTAFPQARDLVITLVPAHQQRGRKRVAFRRRSGDDGRKRGIGSRISVSRIDDMAKRFALKLKRPPPHR